MTGRSVLNAAIGERMDMQQFLRCPAEPRVELEVPRVGTVRYCANFLRRRCRAAPESAEFRRVWSRTWKFTFRDGVVYIDASSIPAAPSSSE